jgi:polar amino acid transport system substrate-binding protein
MRHVHALIGPLLLACATALGDEIRLVSLEYPPYSSRALANGGCFLALSTRAFALSGHRTRITFQPWLRAKTMLRHGEHDAILPLWPNEAVEERLLASAPAFHGELGFFMRRDRPVRFDQLTQLRGSRVGTVRGYGYPEAILHSGFVAEEAVDDLSNLYKLLAGRFNLALMEKVVGNELIARNPALNRLVWQGRVLQIMPLIIGFAPPRSGAPDWPALYAQGLRQLQASGEYQRIVKPCQE